jgi:hypothetical protein
MPPIVPKMSTLNGVPLLQRIATEPIKAEDKELLMKVAYYGTLREDKVILKHAEEGLEQFSKTAALFRHSSPGHQTSAQGDVVILNGVKKKA